MKPSDQERELEALFRAGRADPSVDDLKRLEGRLEPWLSRSSASALDGRRGLLFKSLLILVASGALYSTGSWLFDAGASGGREREVTVAQPTNDDGRATKSVAVAETPPLAAPSTGASMSVADLPDVPAALPSKSPTAASKTNPARDESSSTARANTARNSGSPAADSSISKISTITPIGIPNSPARGTDGSDAPPDVRSESEASYLRRAQTALNANPALALQMLNEHSARFPHGVLLQERDVMAIDSLARLGRIEEARERARAFRTHYPQSAHESRIASILKEGTP